MFYSRGIPHVLRFGDRAWQQFQYEPNGTNNYPKRTNNYQNGFSFRTLPPTSIQDYIQSHNLSNSSAAGNYWQPQIRDTKISNKYILKNIPYSAIASHNTLTTPQSYHALSEGCDSSILNTPNKHLLNTRNATSLAEQLQLGPYAHLTEGWDSSVLKKYPQHINTQNLRYITEGW